MLPSLRKCHLHKIMFIFQAVNHFDRIHCNICSLGGTTTFSVWSCEWRIRMRFFSYFLCLASCSGVDISDLLFICWSAYHKHDNWRTEGAESIDSKISDITCNVQMEFVYERFDSYDFEGDDNFQRGLRSIQEKAAEHMLRLKLFYYNRFVKSLDVITCYSIVSELCGVWDCFWVCVF